MMTHPTQPIRRLLDRAQKRFIRSRPGSVLILVVALLVMMALIGTAYMTMAQFDRGTAIVHSFNTEVDLLLDGVINQVKGTIVNDLFTGGQFRPAVTMETNGAAQTPVTYNAATDPAAPRYWDGLGLDNIAALPIGDWWLASRVPSLPSDFTATPGAAPAATNLPLWPYITGPINGAATFDQPYWPSSTPPAALTPTMISPRFQLVPTYSQTPTQQPLTIDGQVLPAFTNTAGAASGNWFMAADTDGDGIADAGLVKLLTLDGVTYYAAVRVVDNSAAINASIAEVPNPATTFSAGVTLPGDLTPVNIDLAGMVVPPTGGGADDLTGPPSANGAGLLANFRWNGNTNPATVAIDDAGKARKDFFYPTDGGLYFNAQWFQLGRRLRNPGFIGAGVRYQALPISEDLTMAKGFVLRNPNSPNATLSASVLEQRMPNTLFNPARATPYVPDPTTTPYASFPYPLLWFADSFYYTDEYSPTGKNLGKNYLPKRALFVGQNPVSNFAPGRFNMSPAWPVNQYQFGDVYTDPNTGWKYVCICPNPPQLPQNPLDQFWSDPYWAWEPWSDAPTKTSANTATFQQLYAAYWAVMADQYVPSVVGGASVTPSTWTPPFPQAGTSVYRMFRSPIRDGAIDGVTKPTSAKPIMSPQQVMQLRAAIAAVNTMALRHGDQVTLNANGTNDVISRTISLPDPTGGGNNFWATVYGVERQPYITQVFARNDTDATNDWIAVELYNPYPVPINLTNWVLATVNRSSFTAGLTLTPLVGNLQAAAPGLTSIGANERVVLMSSLSPPSTILIDATAPATTANPCRYIACTSLTQAFGAELTLMRPRSANGSGYISYTANPQSNNQFTEGQTGAGLDDLVPIDSYDLSNMPATASSANNIQEWWYRRPNDPASNKQWHFVYPGPWMLVGGTAPPPGTTPPTWTGTYAFTPAPAQTDLTGGPPGGPPGPTNPNPTPLGTPVPSLTTPPSSKFPTVIVPWQNYHDTAIQVNNQDFGGGNKPNGPTLNSLPLGAFQRDGDLLQVTFIGCYKIWIGTGPSDAGQRVQELNPVTADAAMATAGDLSSVQEPIVTNPGTGAGAGTTSQTYAENIGRFCPIDKLDAAAAGSAGLDDFATTATTWRYHWATRLFDFLSVQSPQDDYLPNVDPWSNDAGYPAGFRYTPANFNTTFVPVPVANLIAGKANSGLTSPTPALATVAQSEDVVPIDGLVNVNSAPWRVLAAVPWIPATYPDFRLRNAQIAMALVTCRDVNDNVTGKPHGPFRSLFELGEATLQLPTITGLPSPPAGMIQLRDILKVEGGAAASSATYTPKDGNLAPLTGAAAVAGDFQGQFNTITRLSNLITTRSDSYTAYVLIQGWRNAETPNPHLVVQRRAAVIIDRSNVTPSNRSPNAVNVPMN